MATVQWTRSVFHAYGGHKVPLSPTAFPKKANGKEFVFRSIWEALQKQGKNLHKGNHRSPATCEKWKNKITEGPNPGNSPGVGALLLRGKLPSLFIFYFRLANGYRAMDA